MNRYSERYICERDRYELDGYSVDDEPDCCGESMRPEKKKKNRHNKELGERGEDAAALFLLRRGYDILERNWRCFAGEADIIAQDGDTLVFVEVKTRSGIKQGFPSEAVDAAKRDRYEKIALAYLSEYDHTDIPVRFDVISIVAVSHDRACVRHQIGAFSVS